MNKRVKKRFLTLAAYLLTAGLFFVSCSEQTGSDGVVPDGTPASGTESTTEGPLDLLPEKDFEGYNFKIIAQHTDERPNLPGGEETGEPINDALYRRNAALEKRLNIKIENIGYTDRGQLYRDVLKSVQAQDSAYDLVLTSMADGINVLAPAGALYDLKSLSYLSLDSSLWNKSIYENMQINGKLFYSTGPVSPSSYITPVVFLYNKAKTADYGVDDMTRLVLENKWTADALIELIKINNRDLDGDGVLTDKDFFTLAHDNGVTGQALFTAFGQKMSVKDSDTFYKLNFDSEEALSMIDFCAGILSNPDNTFNGAVKPFKPNSELDLFREGRTLFLITTVNNLFSFKTMEDDYGILPLPKYNEAQDNYITLNNPWAPSGIAVPVYCDNEERTGLILETMAALSYEYVRPAMYDIIIKNKYSRDEFSQQMLDIVYSTSSFELSTIHDFGGSAILMRDAACGSITNFVSKYEAIKPKAEKAIVTLVEAYQSID